MNSLPTSLKDPLANALHLISQNPLSMIIHCHKCKGEILEPIRFRSTCPHCETDLHCCINCRYYLPGKPNDCSVPKTEPVRDREMANFCEEFKVALVRETESVEEKKKRFLSLFTDPS